MLIELQRQQQQQQSIRLAVAVQLLPIIINECSQAAAAADFAAYSAIGRIEWS